MGVWSGDTVIPMAASRGTPAHTGEECRGRAPQLLLEAGAIGPLPPTPTFSLGPGGDILAGLFSPAPPKSPADPGAVVSGTQAAAVPSVWGTAPSCPCRRR